MNVYFDEFLKKPDVGIPPIPPHLNHPEEITKMGETYLWVVFAVMAAGVVVFTALTRRAAYRFRALYVTNLLILIFAAISYFAMATGIGKTVIHSDPHHRSNYRDVYYARYIDWIFTTPLLILDLTLLSGLPIAETVILIVANEIMIVTGIIAALHPSLKYRWGFYAFSCTAFLYVIWALVTSARSYAFLRHPKVGSLYNQVSLALVVVWT
jgi:bacteriorhodopsin